MKQRKKEKTQWLCLVISLISLLHVSAFAQNVNISGTVTDETGQPMVGATVIVKNTTIGVITNIDGRYSIAVPNNATLQFQFLGYVTKEQKIEGKNQIDVQMTPDSHSLEGLVVVGYGTQKKGSITGAVSGVEGASLMKTKNENPQNMLNGRVPGVRVWQKSSEPGAYNNNFDIRGMGAPLIIIDGVPRTSADFQRLNPTDIENISVLKDASAAIYGVRAANGVVLVTTKKGSSTGKVSITYNGSYTIQRPSNMPQLASAFDAMTIYNEKSMNNTNGGSLVFDKNDFEALANGAFRTTDWNSLIFANNSPQTHHDISISGGTEKTQYYIAGGYFYQEGFFKSGDMNYNKFNLRSNVSSEIAKGLKLDLNLSAMSDERNNPFYSAIDIIKNYWTQGVLVPAFADPEGTMLNYEGLDQNLNTVAMMTADISGYRKYHQKNFQSSAALNYDFGKIFSVLKGLTAKGLLSFDFRLDNNAAFRKEYTQYAYNSETGEYDSRVYANSSPSRMRREQYTKQQSLLQFVLSYNKKIKDHKIEGLLGFETQKRVGDNFYAQRDLAFANDYLLLGVEDGQLGGMSSSLNDVYEEANSAIIGRANYNYKEKYMAEFQFRYDASSKFAEGYQWGFFPSASVGWRVSEESFVKNTSALSFIQQLKLRASYGVLGDDGSLAYDWATGYTYPATNSNSGSGYYNQYAPGYVFGDEFIYAADLLSLPNKQITWYTSQTFDVGVDFDGWNGLLGFSFDYFSRHRKGIFDRRGGELPTIVGAEAPRENLNEDRHFGMDLELRHRNKIGDFGYSIQGLATITRQKYITAANQGPYANSYDRWKNDNLSGRYQGTQFGYEALGRFDNWQEIWDFNQHLDNGVLPGDYQYLDWNGDGEINDLDTHPIAFDQTPWLNFSLNLDANYKSWDLNLLFQGSALGSMEYKEPLYSIWSSVPGGGVLEQYTDRWRPVNATADPYNPNTDWISGYYAYTGRYPSGNSEFNRVSTAYLRLKSIELGYTLPKLQVLPSMKLRIFANAYNVITFTGVKFVDPEHPDDDLGRVYPLNKTFTFGVSASF
ncbi:MAG: SusC/RagA family TonB-linked outer membrane protein [Bacteroidales bacterium]